MEFELNNIYNVNAYEAIKRIPDKSVDLIGITDDASIVEKCGYKVKVVECLSDNRKLTLKEDFNNL